jgi:hypothetical protein
LGVGVNERADLAKDVRHAGLAVKDDLCIELAHK